MRDVTRLLSEQERSDIVDLCGRCLYHTLQTCVRAHGTGETTFVGELCGVRQLCWSSSLHSVTADLEGNGTAT